MHNIAQYYKERYSEISNFQKMHNSDFIYFDSKNTTHWNSLFQNSLIDFLYDKSVINAKNVDLKQMHNFVDQKYFTFETVGDQNNSRPKISDIGFEFLEYNKGLYLQFLKWLRLNVITKDFYFQKIPTIRFHIAGIDKRLNLPAWHSDSFLGHSPKEINLWFGLTENEKSDFWLNNVFNSRNWFEQYSYDRSKWNNNCFSSDKEFMQKGFQNAFEVQDIFNTIAIFDSRCIHAVDYRSTRDYTTKITIDLRIILVEDFDWIMINNKPIFVGEGIKKAEFKPGGNYGYDSRSIEELIYNEKL